MKMLRWLILFSVLLVAGYFGQRLWVEKLSTPNTPRPLFHEWEERDQGWKWASYGPATDQSGNWLYCDKTLNLLVLIATQDPQFTGSHDFYEPTHALIHAKSAYETKVDATTDLLLIIVPGPTRGQFRIKAGFAGRVYDELWERSPQDLIRDIVRLYRGPDKQALLEFIDKHFAAGAPAPRGSGRGGSESKHRPEWPSGE